MQTFCPFPDFKKSACCLDRQRLGKQRSEAKGILLINLGLQRNAGYANHPATLMWRGYEHALIKYTLAICEEWQNRGYKDEVWSDIYSLEEDLFDSNIEPELPGWFGMEALHRNHRQRLIEKLPSHYKVTLKWQEEPTLQNLWPTLDLSSGQWTLTTKG